MFKQIKSYRNYKWISNRLVKFKRKSNYNLLKVLNLANKEKVVHKHQRVQELRLQLEFKWKKRNSIQPLQKNPYRCHLIVSWMNQLILTNCRITELHIKQKLKKWNNQQFLMLQMINKQMQKTFILIQALVKTHQLAMGINLQANCISLKKIRMKSLRKQDRNESNNHVTKNKFYVIWVMNKLKN